MTRKRLIATLLTAALLVTAGCTGGIGSAGDAANDGGANGAVAQQGQPDRTVSVSASGEVTADPDRAVLDVAVEATDEDPETVRQRLAENASRMRSALEEMGIEDDRITTQHYVIRQNRESRENPDVTSYRGIHAFEVEVDDVDSVGAVVETAVNNGATNVGSVRFTLSEDARTDLREDALGEAVDNARADAEVLASNTDLTVTGVSSVSTGRVDVRPYRAEAQTAAAGDAGTNIESGPVSVTAQVQVTYNATEN